MKTKRSINNLISGLISQLVMVAAGIMIPRLVLLNLGSEVNGLVSSINQIFIYLSLLEAGVGTATLQALYGPVGRGDKQSISGILSATDRYYKRTGIIYFIAFMALAIIYPIIVPSTISKPIIFVVIVLTGLSGVVSFFFQGKYNILLLAEGKNYINSNLGSIIYIFSSISKIVLLLLGFNVIALQAAYFFLNVLKMIYIEWYIKHNYKWLDLNVKPDYDAISQKNSVLVHQVSSIIFNNTDILILTLISGLEVVSIYSIYTLFFGMISTTIMTISGSVQFILGQMYNNNRKLYQKWHDAYELYNMATIFSLYCIFNIFILPFMKLYTSGVEDINYIDNLLPYLFITINLLNNGRESSNLAIKFAGHFKNTQVRSIIEALINITVSLICVWNFGIYGVLIGTIVALLYRANDMILYANHHILNRNSLVTYKRWFLNLGIFIIFTFFSRVIDMNLTNYINIIIWGVISCMIIIPSFILINSLAEYDTACFVGGVLKSRIKKFVNRL